MKHTKGQSMPDGTIQYYKDVMGRAMISTDYDPTSSYAVGDYCIYDNVRYCCNTAIASGGETWNSAHWDVAKVDDDITEIKNSLSDLTSNDELYKTSSIGDTNEHEYSLNYSALNYLFISIEVSWVSSTTFTGILTIPSAVWVKTNGTDTTRIYTNNNPSNSYIEVLTRSSGKIKVKASNANVGLRITGIGKIA